MTAAPISTISAWCGRCSGRAGCSAGSPRSAIGSTSAATCPAASTRAPPRACQEGVRIPPVKLIREGRLNEDIVDDPLGQQPRPQSNYGDLNGQLNALDLGERRLADLLDEYGEATVSAAFEAFTRRAEALMRANIAALPDGRVQFRGLSRQRRRDRRKADDRARPDDRGRGDDARFLALLAALRRAAQHRALDGGRLLLCRAQARLHRCARQRRMSRADAFRHSRDDPAWRLVRPSRSAAIPRRSCA